jgi:hypothetical protein
VGTVRSTTHRSLARLRALAPELAALDEPDDPPPTQSSLGPGGTSAPAGPSDDSRGATGPASPVPPLEARP